MLLSVSRTNTRFVLLPPKRNTVFPAFQNINTDSRRHDDLLAEMQRFRGGIYSADGAIQPHELTSDGRHAMAVDEHSWHIFSLDPTGRICACVRYLEETGAAGFDKLWVRHAAISSSNRAVEFREAVEREMSRARQSRIGFGEAGGWAVAERYRRTTEPLRILLAVFGLMELLGGCAGVATATFRHGSAAILRRIGLSPLSANGGDLPSYYDPQYGCEMEVLRYDSRFMNPKYSETIRELSASLALAPVIHRCKMRTALQVVPRGMKIPIPASAQMADTYLSAE